MNKLGLKTLTFCALSSATLAFAHDEQADQRWRNTVWAGFDNFFMPDWKQDFSATVGVKLWMNEWRRDQFVIDGAFGSRGTDGNIPFSLNIAGAPRGQTSGTEVSPIPQISVRYKWLIATGSYYAETDFDFPTTTRLNGIGSTSGANTVSAFDEKVSASRYEWDVAAGFYVHPNIALLGGYKQMRQNIRYSSQANADPRLNTGGDDASNAGNQLLNYTSDGRFDVGGPTIGIAGSVPMGNGFGVYGSYAHGFLTLDDGSGDLFFPPRFASALTPITNVLKGEKDVAYDVAEVGVTYTYGLENLPAHLPLNAATAYLGYRYQAFETDLQLSLDGFKAADRSDKTQGFVAGVNISF